jgi:dipeptidyl aminopeptidase/acylaminoacyl peptidase
MKVVTRIAGNTALALLGLAAGSLFQPAPAAAAAPALPSLVAYVRSGDVYVSKGAAETRLTRDGGYSRPRWSPDGKQLALLKAGRLWTMKADGTAKRRLTTRAAAGPAWAPDGKSIAFASLSCSGGPGVYRISAVAATAQPQVMFPRDCRTEPLPAEPAITAAAATVLSDRLRTDDAVAWSPDGTRVAFRGGNCESTYDACLSIGVVATGGETTVAAYGGGSLQGSGFAVVPSWRADGAKMSWTAFQQGETAADNKPVHLVEYDAATGAKRIIGGALDREMAYVDATRGVATGQNQGGSWVLLVNLAGGTRTPFHQGSQPSVQPTR